jgi:hypothetical protein
VPAQRWSNRWTMPSMTKATILCMQVWRHQPNVWHAHPYWLEPIGKV